jgi:hypothetical protein
MIESDEMWNEKRDATTMLLVLFEGLLIRCKAWDRIGTSIDETKRPNPHRPPPLPKGTFLAYPVSPAQESIRAEERPTESWRTVSQEAHHTFSTKHK